MNQVAVIETDATVVAMNRARLALAEAKTIQQTKLIVDTAAAAEIYAKRQKLGEEASELALSIKIEALRKLGEMLAATPKATGAAGTGRPNLGGSKTVPPKTDAPTLAELGLSKKESAVAQKLAALPESDFQQVRDGHITVAKAIAAVDAGKKRSAAAPGDARGAAVQTADAPVAIAADPQAGASADDEYAVGATPDDAEIRAWMEQERSEIDALLKIAAADDKLQAALAEIKRLVAELRVVKSQRDQYMNEGSSAKELAKSRQNKIARLEKRLKEAA